MCNAGIEYTDIKHSLDLIDLPISLTWQKLKSVFVQKKYKKKIILKINLNN